jgi:polyferredoxin
MMAVQLLSDTLMWIVGLGLTLAGMLTVFIWKKDKTKRITYLRVVLRVAALVGMYFLFASTAWLLAVLIIIVVATLFVGRFFCGWVCPFGLYMDVVSLTREAVKKGYRRLPERLNKALNTLRYPLFLFFFGGAFCVYSVEHVWLDFCLLFHGRLQTFDFLASSA